MKKILVTILCFALLLSSTACVNQNQDIALMFESFDNSENIILLTAFELVVNGTHYDLDNIKYNDQLCNIVLLDENGFYSYTYNQDTLSVEFLYTLYETFDTTSLGTEILPSEIINAFWGDNCFWFRNAVANNNIYLLCINAPGIILLLKFHSIRSIHSEPKTVVTPESVNYF